MNTVSNYQPSFGKMFTGENAKMVLKEPNCPKRIVNEFTYVRTFLRRQGLNKLSNVDMLLDYSSKNKRFELEVLPKDRSYPKGIKSAVFEKIIDRPDIITQMHEWADYWNKKFALQIK